MSDTILAVETSTPHASIALWRNGEIVFEESFTSERSHNALVFGPLGRSLEIAGTLRCLVVGTGPGSYTGIRIGIAALLGISLAKVVPLIGLPSLLAWGEPTYAVVGDARRGSWHFSVISGRAIDGPHTGSAAEIEARCTAFSGPIVTFDASPPPFCQAQPVIPAASRLAVAASFLNAPEIAALAAVPVEPCYLAAPFVTTPKIRPGFQK